MNRQPMTVTRLEEGLSLCDWLTARLKCSKRRAKALLDTRRVWVNRQCVWMVHHRVKAGDLVRLPAEAAIGTTSRAAPPLPVLFEDARFWVVNKPPGVLSIGAHSVELRMRAQTGVSTLCAAHRLDLDTSGCLLLARDPEAMNVVIRMFKARKVVKRYLAIVVGRYTDAVSTLKTPVDETSAVTHIRCIRNNRTASYLSIRIETGRTHQIRRHLASLRHPLAGDRQYGMVRHRRATDADWIATVPRVMLHAQEISLPNPFGEAPDRLRAHAPLPADFHRTLKSLGLLA